MGDLISRQAAIDALDKVAEMFPYKIPGDAKTYRQYNEAWSDAIDAAENALEALLSAQQTVLTAEDIETIRIHLSAFKEKLCNQGRWTEAAEYERLIQRLTGEGGQ